MSKALILEYGTDSEGFSIYYDKKKKALYFEVHLSDKTAMVYKEKKTLRDFREDVRFYRLEDKSDG